MNKRIQNYKDLMGEKARLEGLLIHQKAEFRYNLNELKEQYSPIVKLGSFIGLLTTKNYKYPLLNAAADLFIGVWLKNKILARAGWVYRLLIPFFMKNVSSHVIKRYASRLFTKLGNLIKQN